MTMIAVLAVSLGLAGPSAADAQVKEDRDASSELRKMLAGFGDDVAVTSNEAGSLAVVSIPLDHPEIASIQARLDQASGARAGQPAN